MQDAEITFRVQTNKMALGGDQYAYFVARRLSNGTEYRGRLRFSPNGKVRLQAFWVPLSLVETPLGPEVLVPELDARCQYILSRPGTDLRRQFDDYPHACLGGWTTRTKHLAVSQLQQHRHNARTGRGRAARRHRDSREQCAGGL